MDASTFVVARMNEHRARELDRDLAHLASQDARREALGDTVATPRRRRLSLRRRPATSYTSTELTLAGPST